LMQFSKISCSTTESTDETLESNKLISASK
jgi:hypothetical protein